MNNTSSNILLSICIPTYNRSVSLDRALKSIVEQDSFDQKVEIVISDNCSTDGTNDVVSRYMKMHENIVYHRNEINITDKNFTMALSLGRGEYLKLMNDTIILKAGALNLLLTAIQNYCQDKPAMFFFNNNERHANELIICTDLNQFVNAASYYIGWNVNFGTWKSQFDKLENLDRCSYLQFLQIDWTLRLLKNRKSVICFGDWISMQPMGKKGGYNLFEVHIDNYLFLYQTYLNSKTMSYRIYKTEKNRLLKYFISDWFYLLLLKKDSRFNYYTDGWQRILWRHYKMNPVLYMVLFKQTLRYVYNKILNNNHEKAS